MDEYSYDEEKDELTCKTHGAVEIVKEDSNPGFAGGTIYWAELSCGCTVMDEGGDVAAAY